MRLAGIAVSSGIAFGEAVVYNPFDNSMDYRLLPLAKIPQELNKLTQALQRLCQQLQTSLDKLTEDSDNFQLVEADLLLLEDAELIQQIRESISGLQFSATAAVERVFAHQASELEALEDPYLANRAQDVRCLGRRLISSINGADADGLDKLKHDSILLAQDLTPAEFALLPLEHIKGIILKTGGLTSHTAILARAAGIPALLSCNYQTGNINAGDPLILDANQGALFVRPEQTEVTELKQRFEREQARRSALEQYRDRQTQTRDGKRISLMANVGNLNEISRLPQVGAEGIGLFRTEFMLMDVSCIPDEKAQYNLYCDALQLLNGQPFTIRTLDIGADKELPCLDQAIEDNPALGMRGVRYTLKHPEILQTQLRAVLRAANHGPVRLMLPMVNQVEELDAVLDMLEHCKQQLSEAEKGYGEISLGIVVETPAAVMNLPTLLPKLDFISIGTNDLTQYAMAADRTNPELTRDYPSFSPAILRLIAMTIADAKAADIRVSLCGELAGDPRIAPILMGMGLDELSVNPGSVLEVKAALCEGNFSQFADQAKKALACTRLSELTSLISLCH